MARQFDPALGRFLQADTIIPDPANPQSLNRYSYVLNSPLRYTDPSGHFEEDEIDRYLEFQLGITDADERLRIITSWKNDKSGWWSIIGPGGATYGDILDGTKLNLLGQPSNRVHGQFRRDRQNNTFTFTSEEFILEMPGNWGAWDIKASDSLIEFHSETKDVIWKRYNADRDEWIYQSGTGYAANNGSIEWLQGLYSVGAAATAIRNGISGLGFLVVPSPDPLTKGLGIASLTVSAVSVVKCNEHGANFSRSVGAAYRLNFR